MESAYKTIDHQIHNLEGGAVEFFEYQCGARMTRKWAGAVGTNHLYTLMVFPDGETRISKGRRRDAKMAIKQWKHNRIKRGLAY